MPLGSVGFPAVTDPIARAKELEWYHTIELSPEYTTPGMFDLRPVVDLYGLPERMDGLRALDVGTWDGFWAFEMERRGADVTALDLDDMQDLDWPAIRRPETFPDTKRGDGFRLAKELSGSKVERVTAPSTTPFRRTSARSTSSSAAR